ncbi:alanine racemase [Alteromonas gilva]|uniref:Alanine racemase n=1 Tax=Alteromonas gilva TaxID=2987522 RepID=A0ABT5L604_9ALTE|nr:alanine racemase [Alteromonas gilva]MDC8831801.1 alanine racemase [Alteromonas gilva]
MISLSQVPTPACIIDFDIFKRNCQRMLAVAESEQIVLRPHVKTLKSLQAAKYYAPSSMPVTVSTLAEARYFASAGYTDILYAVGIAPNKLNQLDAILRLAADFTVIADSLAAVNTLIDFAPQYSQSLAVMLEVDVDDHRAGLLPESDELIACARAIQNASNLRFRGVMTHAGGSYDCLDSSARQAMAKQECERISAAAGQLARHGIQCDIVSAGSTPTALAGVSHQGITELRAGVYATFDCVMAGLGVCQVTDIAMSVLTCVIGHQRSKNWVIVDAGWMALSRDQGTAGHHTDCGYGLVCDINGQVLDGWYVKATNQEHGIICHRDNIEPPEALFSYGQVLRILPVHACATAAQYQQYHVVDDTLTVSQQWSRISGW